MYFTPKTPVQGVQTEEPAQLLGADEGNREDLVFLHQVQAGGASPWCKGPGRCSISWQLKPQEINTDEGHPRLRVESSNQQGQPLNRDHHPCKTEHVLKASMHHG